MQQDRQKLSFIFKYALEQNLADWTEGPASQNEQGFATSAFTNNATGETLTVSQIGEEVFNAKGKNFDLNASLPVNWQLWP